MYAVSLQDVLLTMSASLFLIGMVTFAIGVYILSVRATGNELLSLSRETTKLVSKGIAEDIAGLVGNAGALLETLAQMVRTTAGVGVFLTLTGSVLMIIGFWIVLRIH